METVFYIYQKSGFSMISDYEIDCFETRAEAEYNLRVLKKYDPGNHYYIYEGKENTSFLENADSFCYGYSD